MKKIVLFFFALAIVNAGYCQFNKGRILAGGSIGFQSNTLKTETSSATTTVGTQSSLTFSPKAGYFFMDNLAAGAGIDLTSSTFKADGSGGKFTSSQTMFTPFVRYYINPGIFFQGNFGIGSSKDKSTSGSTTTTTTYSDSKWSLGAGYAYFLNDFVAVEPFIGYGASTSKNKTSNNKDLQSGLFINIGFQIYLGSK